MSSLRVTPAQLQHLGGRAQGTSSDIRGQHLQLRKELSPLFGADWSGAAAAQFTQLYEDFDQHAKGLSDALDGIGGLLHRAGANYEEVESTVVASFR